MSILSHREVTVPPWKEARPEEGIVVWDQKGLVVLWPDGHCSRFSWLALRQACSCSECQSQATSSHTPPQPDRKEEHHGLTWLT